MFVSLRHKFLFVHIMKTGGTSVRAVLKPLRWRDPWWYPQLITKQLAEMSNYRVGYKLPAHSGIIAAQEVLPAGIFDEMYSFAFVRNPWDHQVSAWHFFQKEHPDKLGPEVTDFSSFVRWKFDPEIQPKLEPEARRVLRQSNRRMRDYVVDLDGKVIVTRIGRFESLAADFATICSEIGIRPKPLPTKRRSDRKRDYREYYDDVSAAAVAEHFASDVEMFGYDFDPPVDE